MSSDNSPKVVPMPQKTATLIAALLKAKGEFRPVVKDATNPHFKSGYASLNAYLDATAGALQKHGLAIVQAPRMLEGNLVLSTRILHESGETLDCGEYPVNPSKPDPQGFGSALTYARRYSYAAVLGLSAEDDDGNAASNGKHETKKAEPPKPGEAVITQDQIAKVFARAREMWKGLKTDRVEKQLHDIAAQVAGVDSLKAIPQSRLDAVLRAITGQTPEEEEF